MKTINCQTPPLTVLPPVSPPSLQFLFPLILSPLFFFFRLLTDNKLFVKLFKNRVFFLFSLYGQDVNQKEILKSNYFNYSIVFLSKINSMVEQWKKLKLTFFFFFFFFFFLCGLLVGKKDIVYIDVRIKESFNNPCHHRVSGSTSWIAYYNQLAIGYLPSTTRNGCILRVQPSSFFYTRLQ